ncbi:MAG: hypothetical protein AAF597_02095 [Bacteroidota bacterium]
MLDRVMKGTFSGSLKALNTGPKAIEKCMEWTATGAEELVFGWGFPRYE